MWLNHEKVDLLLEHEDEVVEVEVEVVEVVDERGCP